MGRLPRGSPGRKRGQGGEGLAVDGEGFIARWADAPGTERQNSQSFLRDLCDLLGVERPGEPGAGTPDDYVFERPVEHEERGLRTTRFLDLYRRGCFILESKQSSQRGSRGARDPRQTALPHLPEAAQAAQGSPHWDRIMRRAYLQARAYVADLPPDHPAPPFLILVDVGRVIELYADFTGQGRNYAQFPDRASFQITMEALRDPQRRDRLRRVWTDPHGLNPARATAEVTRDVAERLARVAARLERRHEPAEVAGFLMRCLFTMFAEDARLIPKDGFKALLADLRTRPADFRPALEALWASMDAGGYDPALRATLRRFNGGLFADRTALTLDADGIGELEAAAKHNWREVEPAIFGTLLERALDPRERSRLGAHYTPRAYVERLVVATVIEPLREEWETAQARMDELVAAGDVVGARAVAHDVHRALCHLRILDPACGTGNFLYVALELLKRLEGEVLERIEALGGQEGLGLAGESVDPSQFLGIEKNPRAAAIAEVVLWVGYLQWQLRTGGLAAIPDPVLKAHATIECRDAVLEWSAVQPRLDEGGQPVTEWDRRTFKLHPITGEAVPDPDARVPALTYLGPRRAPWPEADFIVGNPPFIGGGFLRDQLGDGYAEALWAARPEVQRKADFVMHWWDEAARRLAEPKGRLRRFGFITTNSITQTFGRRVVERHLRNDRRPVSLAFAVPDHPWVKGSGRAAVRIAMTVAARGTSPGVLATVAEERDLDTDAPRVRLETRRGTITAKLALGADVTAARPLLATEGLSSNGVMLAGAGFLVSPQEARGLGLGTVPGVEDHIPPYRGGRDITARPAGDRVIDLFGLGIEEVRDRFPALYGHVADHVKPHRDSNNRRAFRERWWVFGEPRKMMRGFLAGLPRFIVTVETTKHRLFRFLPEGTRPDHMLVAIGLDDAAALALLSSRVHVAWAIAAGGWLGVGNDPRYSKTKTFDPFPFPALLSDPAPDAHAAALRHRLRDLGERLEAMRDAFLAADRHLTLTGLYNRLERRRPLRAGRGGGPPARRHPRSRRAARRDRPRGAGRLGLGRPRPRARGPPRRDAPRRPQGARAGGGRGGAARAPRRAQRRAPGRGGAGAGALAAPRPSGAAPGRPPPRRRAGRDGRGRARAAGRGADLARGRARAVRRRPRAARRGARAALARGRGPRLPRPPDREAPRPRRHRARRHGRHGPRPPRRGGDALRRPALTARTGQAPPPCSPPAPRPPSPPAAPRRRGPAATLRASLVTRLPAAVAPSSRSAEVGREAESPAPARPNC